MDVFIEIAETRYSAHGPHGLNNVAVLEQNRLIVRIQFAEILLHFPVYQEASGINS